MARSLKEQINGDKETKIIDASGIDKDGVYVPIMPEKSLLCSYLERAIMDYKRKHSLDGYDNSFYITGNYPEPDYWFECTINSQEPFSFGWVCEQLSPNPTQLKRAIIIMLENYKKNKKKGLTVT